MQGASLRRLLAQELDIGDSFADGEPVSDLLLASPAAVAETVPSPVTFGGRPRSPGRHDGAVHDSKVTESHEILLHYRVSRNMGWCSINSLCLLQNFIWWQKSSGRQVLRFWPSLKNSSLLGV
ncbi:hypothetical protein AV530_009875 [Patagioenas fasciata monilis]|uniref:Uncharacterized protein n=1 Tax=Patagioenas fasciata monilis TaxID=372326 RepID=A0A1V4KAC7_PATFA|nr:hypothetical protein AV530_009875 [Patagioenas fasciata monilis]